MGIVFIKSVDSCISNWRNQIKAYVPVRKAFFVYSQKLAAFTVLLMWLCTVTHR